MNESKRSTGQNAEKLALNFLKEQGLSLVETNFYCKLGEIDLIMRDKNVLVFVEVRCRQPSRYGTAAESINNSKRKKLLKAAAFYLQQHKLANKTFCRFDAVSINLLTQDIRWIKQAFSE